MPRVLHPSHARRRPGPRRCNVPQAGSKCAPHAAGFHSTARRVQQSGSETGLVVLIHERHGRGESHVQRIAVIRGATRLRPKLMLRLPKRQTGGLPHGWGPGRAGSPPGEEPEGQAIPLLVPSQTLLLPASPRIVLAAPPRPSVCRNARRGRGHRNSVHSFVGAEPIGSGVHRFRGTWFCEFGGCLSAEKFTASADLNPSLTN